MKIGELARRSGVSVRMLRYYETEGLLAPARRDSGYRDYGAEDEAKVAAIRQLNAAGLKLNFIRRFLPCLREEAPLLHPCPELMAAIEQELRQLDARIDELSRCRALLDKHHAQMRQARDDA